MEYLRGHRVVFDDPEWLSKIGVAGLLLLSGMCIPILGQVVVLGWEVETMRRDLRGERNLPALPLSFEAWKPYLDLGFKHFLVQMIYTVPAVMLFLPVIVVLQVGSFAMVHRAGPEAAWIPAAAMLCSFPVFMLAFVVAATFMIYAQLRVGLTGDLTKAFAFSEIASGVKRIWKETLIGLLVAGFVGFLLQLVGMLACIVGLFFTVSIQSAALGILRADLARLDADRGGPPLPGTVTAEIVETFR